MGARRKPTSQPAWADWQRWLNREAMSAALRHHLSSGIDSWVRLGHRPVNSLLTIGVIAIALALPAVLYLGIRNLGGVGDHWDRLGHVSVYLTPGTGSDRAQALAQEWGQRHGILSVTLVSPEQARSELEEMDGFGDALAALSDNPLPWVLVLEPENPTAEALAPLAAELSRLDIVDSAQFDQQWLERLQHLLGIARRALWVIGGLLGLAVILVVGNTIRLDIENRRREIEVTRLLGATDGFVRRPFLYGGLWYGLAGGIGAVMVVMGAAAGVAGPVADLADAYNSPFRLQSLNLWESVQLMALGAVVGWLGAWLAVSRQLARAHPDRA